MNEEDNTEKEEFEEDFEEEEGHDLPFIPSRKATRKEEEELRPSFFFLSLSRSFLSFFSLSLVFFKDGRRRRRLILYF